MSGIQVTLQGRIDSADALLAQGRFGAALSAYEDLIERAQELRDRAVEVVSRSMAARCHLVRGDVESARAHLEAASPWVSAAELRAEASLRGAEVRLALHELDSIGGRQAVTGYLAWAEREGVPLAVVDACALIAERSEDAERIQWLERAADEASMAGLWERAGRLLTELGAAFDALGDLAQALAVYRTAAGHFARVGRGRGRVGALWAAGEAAARLEDGPIARQLLDQAVEAAEEADDAADLLALALADLARVHRDDGDEIEARRCLLRSIRVAREQDLPSVWPARWREVLRLGRALDLDV